MVCLSIYNLKKKIIRINSVYEFQNCSIYGACANAGDRPFTSVADEGSGHETKYVPAVYIPFQVEIFVFTSDMQDMMWGEPDLAA